MCYKNNCSNEKRRMQQIFDGESERIIPTTTEERADKRGRKKWVAGLEWKRVRQRTSFRSPISTTFGHLFGIFVIFNCATVYSQRNNDIFLPLSTGGFWWERQLARIQWSIALWCRVCHLYDQSTDYLANNATKLKRYYSSLITIY